MALTNPQGQFVRVESKFREWVGQNKDFPAEKDRYHLYISLACPWAHRTLIGRALKGLEDVISLSIVDYLFENMLWKFSTRDGCIPDTVNGFEYVKELYLQSDPNYNGRFSVPVLYDKKAKRIVNNESAEILRMFNSEFNAFAKNPSVDLYPEPLRSKIDEVNDFVFKGFNNGVYRAGFATEQAPYEEAALNVKDTLLKIEEMLKNNKFICGDQFTEADVRLFTTALRFDSVYYFHFKCNLVAIKELPNLSRWLESVYQMQGIKETVNMEHIKKHYYMSQTKVNPTQIVPLYDGFLAKKI